MATCARSLSLSLSLSLGVSGVQKSFEGKNTSVNDFLGQRALFYSQNLDFFEKLYFTCTPKNAARCKIFSGNHLHQKQTQP